MGKKSKQNIKATVWTRMPFQTVANAPPTKQTSALPQNRAMEATPQRAATFPAAPTVAEQVTTESARSVNEATAEACAVARVPL